MIWNWWYIIFLYGFENPRKITFKRHSHAWKAFSFLRNDLPSPPRGERRRAKDRFTSKYNGPFDAVCLFQFFWVNRFLLSRGVLSRRSVFEQFARRVAERTVRAESELRHLMRNILYNLVWKASRNGSRRNKDETKTERERKEGRGGGFSRVAKRRLKALSRPSHSREFWALLLRPPVETLRGLGVADGSRPTSSFQHFNPSESVDT